ncbi:MAG: glycosyltransferase family 2 protein, partial [Nitrosopumilus sp.]
NEAQQLEATIQNLVNTQRHLHEIIVIDDCSVMRLGSTLTHINMQGIPLKLIEFDKPRGVGAARHIGCKEASGDIVMVVDAHMRFPTDCINRMLAHIERHPEAIICPCSTAFTECNLDDFCGTGAYLRLDATRGYVSTWLPMKQLDDPCPQVPSVLGACYMLRKPLLERLGGWGPGLRGWGCDEEYISIRAWLLGHEVRLALDTYAAHFYQEKFPSRNTRVGYGSALGDREWEHVYNLHVLARTLPENPLTHLRRLQKSVPSTHACRTIRLMTYRMQPEIARIRKYIQSNRIMSDVQLRRKMRAMHRKVRVHKKWEASVK